MAMKNKLTQKQAKFVHRYVAHGVGARAAREAGYAPGNARISASRLLTSDNVQAAIAAERRLYEAEAGFTRERLVAEIQGAIDLARAQGDARTMIAGWREIGRICGYYDQPKKTAIDVNITARRLVDQFEAMSDTELMAAAQNDVL